MNLNNVTYEMSAGTFQQLPPCTLPEIVFSGRSNVGKSSLINKILNRKNLARVSSQPGKTITINFYKADTASRSGSFSRVSSTCRGTVTQSTRLTSVTVGVR